MFTPQQSTVSTTAAKVRRCYFLYAHLEKRGPACVKSASSSTCPVPATVPSPRRPTNIREMASRQRLSSPLTARGCLCPWPSIAASFSCLTAISNRATTARLCAKSAAVSAAAARSSVGESRTGAYAPAAFPRATLHV